MLIRRSDGRRLLIPDVMDFRAMLARERQQLNEKIAQVEAGFNRDIDRLTGQLSEAYTELARLRGLTARARNQNAEIERMRAEAQFFVVQPEGCTKH